MTDCARCGVVAVEGDYEDMPVCPSCDLKIALASCRIAQGDPCSRRTCTVASVVRNRLERAALKVGDLIAAEIDPGWDEQQELEQAAIAFRTAFRSHGAGTAFDDAWRRLAELGACDAIDGAEYSRVRALWAAARSPEHEPEVEPFIREHANGWPR